jgi:hypothetical protein
LASARVVVRRRAAALAVGARRRTQLREAELDQPVQALADDLLLVDEGHHEARGLTQLDPLERIVSRQWFAHGQLGERAGIGRIGLGPGEPALGKVLRPERIDHHHRHALTAKVTGQGHPVMARRLERDQLDRLWSGRQPRVKSAEPGTALGHPQDGPIGARLTGPTTSDGVALASDIDPDGRHRVTPFRPRGSPCPSSRRPLIVPSPVAAAGSRSPLMAEGRGPDTQINGHLPDSVAPVFPVVDAIIDPLLRISATNTGLFGPLPTRASASIPVEQLEGGCSVH